MGKTVKSQKRIKAAKNIWRLEKNTNKEVKAKINFEKKERWWWWWWW